MMMKKILKYITLSLLAISAGCSYDKGNYEYVELDEPSISGIGDYSVLTYTRLNINPVFGEGFDKTAYEKMASNARPNINSRFEKSFVQDCLIKFYEEILN